MLNGHDGTLITPSTWRTLLLALLALLKMSKIPRVQIKDDLMLTAKPISRLLMIGLTICRAERVSVI